MHGLLLTDTPAVTTPSPWAAGVGGILFLIYITCIRPMRNKGKRDPLARKPGEAMLAQQRAVERDMTALLVEYEQMIRRMTAQVETRVAKLELLMGEADRKLAALKSATNAAAAAVPVANAHVQVDDGTAGQHDAVHPDAPWPVGRRRDERPTFAALSLEREAAVDSAAAALVRAVTGPPTTARSAAASPSPLTNDGFDPSEDLADGSADLSHKSPAATQASPHAELYALADEGLSAGQIARRLGRPHGEVDLILALRPRRAGNSVSVIRGVEPSTPSFRTDRPSPSDAGETKATRDPFADDEAPADAPVAAAARADLAELVGAIAGRRGEYSAPRDDADGTTDAAAEDSAQLASRSPTDGAGPALTPARRDGGHRKHRKHSR